MSSIKIVAIIPARMKASRFPGKPLLKVHGLEMIEHVRRRVLLSQGFSDVVVATCDKKIFDVVKANGGKVVMTSDAHIMASDRVAEAAERIDCTHVINIQGDEILILPEDLELMVEAMKKNPQGKAWNAISNIEYKEQLSDPSIVKCLLSSGGNIMYCNRDFSEYAEIKNFDPVRIILGILGYERKFLFDYGKLPRTPIEILKSIDQSRVIENDIRLNPVTFVKGYPGINEPREVELVENFLENDIRQKEVLSQTL